MKYKKFNNIDISNAIGVSKVGQDTLALAKLAGKQKGKKALDVGTGTGFIAVYLASLGKKVDGTDISTSSIQTSKNNAKKNKVKVAFYQSNLFEKVKDKYNLIIFNPPIGTSSSPKFVVAIEKIKSILPKSGFLFRIGLIFLGGQRKKIIKKFLHDSEKYLLKNGNITMIVSETEIDILNDHKHKLLKDGEVTLALISGKKNV